MSTSGISAIIGRRSELLTPEHVESEYGIARQTQAIWRCQNRYGWGNLAIRIGRRIAYRRSDIEVWLEQRRGARAVAK